MNDRMDIMKQLSSTFSTHQCPECHSNTYCAMEAGKSSSTCWCMTVERKSNPDIDVGEGQCLCRQCLSKK